MNLIIITCTYDRPRRIEFMQSLADHLLYEQNIVWLVVEDNITPDPDVLKLLPPFAVPLACGPTKDGGNLQRNLALECIKRNLTGVVYSIDDDNWITTDIFTELRKVKKFAFLPVGNLRTASKIERPVVVDGKFVGWDANNHYPWVTRKYQVDMAGFAFHSSLLDKLESPLWDRSGSGGESEFITKLGIDMNDVEFLCDNCTKPMVWHNGKLKMSTTEIENRTKVWHGGGLKSEIEYMEPKIPLV